MTREIAGLSFDHVCEIIPESENGIPLEFMPQSRYKNESKLSLNRYGHGPFCRFLVPKRFARRTGVYLILIDEHTRYVGECEDLAKRYNMGYGSISPRNCYEGGQLTNCRINNHVLREHKKDSKIDLYFRDSGQVCHGAFSVQQAEAGMESYVREGNENSMRSRTLEIAISDRSIPIY